LFELSTYVFGIFWITRHPTKKGKIKIGAVGGRKINIAPLVSKVGTAVDMSMLARKVFDVTFAVDEGTVKPLGGDGTFWRFSIDSWERNSQRVSVVVLYIGAEFDRPDLLAPL